jgi:hypothetical protein
LNVRVYRVGDVRQIQIHTAEPLALDPSPLEVKIAIAKFKKNKSPGSDRIPAERIQGGGETLGSIYSLILFGVRKNCLSSETSPSLYQFTRRAIKLTVVIIEEDNCY